MGDFEGAFKIANDNYLKSSDSFDLRARATCSLLLGNYDYALEDFFTLNSLEEQAARTYDKTYMMIALCYYAMGDEDKAVGYFKFPIASRAKIMGTSDISVPGCILFYIAIKLNKQDVLKIALKELKRRRLDAHLFPLDETSETDLDKMFKQHAPGSMRNRIECRVEFYKAIKHLQNGRIEQYKIHLKRCVDLKGLYLEFEYYLAKLEYDRLNVIFPAPTETSPDYFSILKNKFFKK